MNHALIYLWFVLLKRKVLHCCQGLRRPTTLLGFAAVVFLVGCLFHYRRLEAFAQLVRPTSLAGGALLMLGGSLLKGFLQRGLVFEPSDLEFLFTSPFTQRQVVFYRLAPAYLFALVQGLIFLAIFKSHLAHPVLVALCLVFFQVACFHIATGAAIFAGTISDQLHHRLRWMMLGAYCFMTAFYLHSAWDLKLVPSFVSSPLAQLFFYPAVTLADVGAATPVGGWSLGLMRMGRFPAPHLWQSTLYLGSFVTSAAATLWLLLRLKANIFETSFVRTTRAAEKRFRIQQGRRVAVIEGLPRTSVPLPKFILFHGVGAIIWKNLVVAFRLKRELVLASVFTLIYSGFLFALVFVYHDFLAKGGWTSNRDVADFNKGIAMALSALAFFLQWTFSFDFRRDGQHLIGFRALPVSPVALALAEIIVPAAFCLAFQAAGIVMLMFYAHFDWSTLLCVLLTYPAIALALNAVWNLHYLLSATQCAAGKAKSASAIGTLMVVALSFLVFFPAAWVAVQLGSRFNEKLAFAAGLAIQYLVDFLLVLVLAKLFQRFQVARDSQ